MTARAACKSDGLSVRESQGTVEKVLLRDTLAPAGVSPASDLQRRLSEAALMGFYSKKPSRALGGRSAMAVVCGASIVSWVVVFGMGWLMTG